eukprot:gene15463-biopygen1989
MTDAGATAQGVVRGAPHLFSHALPPGGQGAAAGNGRTKSIARAPAAPALLPAPHPLHRPHPPGYACHTRLTRHTRPAQQARRASPVASAWHRELHPLHPLHSPSPAGSTRCIRRTRLAAWSSPDRFARRTLLAQRASPASLATPDWLRRLQPQPPPHTPGYVSLTFAGRRRPGSAPKLHPLGRRLRCLNTQRARPLASPASSATPANLGAPAALHPSRAPG